MIDRQGQIDSDSVINTPQNVEPQRKIMAHGQVGHENRAQLITVINRSEAADHIAP